MVVHSPAAEAKGWKIETRTTSDGRIKVRMTNGPRMVFHIGASVEEALAKVMKGAAKNWATLK